MNLIIEIDNITKVYDIGSDKVYALKGISLNVPKGGFISIMGPSGSGKSTLMHILGCLDKPSTGKYVLDGQRVDSLNDRELSLTRNKKIGFVFQAFNLLPQINILHNVELPLIYAGMNTKKRREISSHYIEKVGLKQRMTHRPNELSGGERQRVAIARALVNDPSIILADEPTGNLDTKTGAEIMNVFRNINDEGKTIVLVTHEDFIAEYSKKIIRIRDGVVEKEEVQAK